MRQPNLFRAVLLTFVIALLAAGLSACGGRNQDEAAPAAVEVEEAPVSVAGDAASGERVYQTACIACHGPDARGVEGLGKSLHPSDSDFVSSQSDEELVEYIKVGRRVDDPLNTTGIDMPPKGGNPALSDADLHNLVAYMRTLE